MLPNNIKKPKAILLDWDNTLADSWGVIHKCLNKSFVAFGMDEWTRDDITNNRQNIHHALRESFPRIFGDDWEKAREVYYKNFLACHIQEIKLLNGALETIQKLREIPDVHLAIVSNKTGQYLRDELEHLNLTEYFDTIIGATDAKRDKPYADPLIMALEPSNIPQDEYKDHVWMVGDSKTDIEAGYSIGCITVLYGDVDHANFENKPHFTIKTQDHFQEIAEHLK